VRVAPLGPWGPGIGWIDHIEVLASRRRRGHGCVAMLAAEEILRGHGCARVVADVPEGSLPGTRLALGLGYAPDSRHLVARVRGGADAPGFPEAPPGTVLRPMDAGEHARWRDDAVAREVALLREAGWPEPVARTRAATGLGGPADGAYALDTRDGRAAVLWIDLAGPVAGRADVRALEVDPAYRRAGHGGYLLRLARYLAYDAGLDEIGVELVGPDPGARRLCAALGYRTVSRRFTKMIL
jgi:GNAT superfamily N-acetyltransferase